MHMSPVEWSLSLIKLLPHEWRRMLDCEHEIQTDLSSRKRARWSSCCTYLFHGWKKGFLHDKDAALTRPVVRSRRFHNWIGSFPPFNDDSTLIVNIKCPRVPRAVCRITRLPCVNPSARCSGNKRALYTHVSSQPKSVLSPVISSVTSDGKMSRLRSIFGSGGVQGVNELIDYGNL